MSNLIVFSLPTETGAAEMAAKLGDLQKQQLITVLDAAIVTQKAGGKPKIKQLNNLVGAGALGGAFWGMLFGLIFFVPILGMAVGAATGALTGAFSDVGIDDAFIKEVAASVKPGTSTLFILVDNAVVDKVVPELQSFNPTIIKSSLSTEQETKLKEMLSAETVQG
jgi:uncharacterized membrane protein